MKLAHTTTTSTQAFANLQQQMTAGVLARARGIRVVRGSTGLSLPGKPDINYESYDEDEVPHPPPKPAGNPVFIPAGARARQLGESSMQSHTDSDTRAARAASSRFGARNYTGKKPVPNAGNQIEAIAICVLCKYDFETLTLFKEWLGIRRDVASDYKLYVHGKDQGRLVEKIQSIQLPIDATVMPTVPTDWSSLGIVEATLSMFQAARLADCDGAVVMSSDGIPIMHPDRFHHSVSYQAGPVRMNMKVIKNEGAVGDQWMALNRAGLEIVTSMRLTDLYDLDHLDSNFEQIMPGDKKNKLFAAYEKKLHYVEDLRTARIETKGQVGLAPDEVVLQRWLYDRLQSDEIQVAKESIIHQKSDEDHALPLSAGFLRDAPQSRLIARKVPAIEGVWKIVRWTWRRVYSGG